MVFPEEHEFVLNQNFDLTLNEQENNTMYWFDYHRVEHIQLAIHHSYHLHAKVRLSKLRQVIHVFRYQIDLEYIDENDS
jgi:hypothetical protein